LPKAWLREHKRDYFYRRAKEEQLRSRAAYKLLEMIEKYGLIQEGDVVVDLGAAPGGWMQVALKAAGESGFILGVDTKEIKPFEATNSRSIVADITDQSIVENIKDFLPGSADVVVSDVSPNISGIWEVDHARQIDLARRSLFIAATILKSGGNFFAKIFQGDLLDDFISETRLQFEDVRLIKPKASRRKSSELFILGMRKIRAKVVK
jgi:23S rRNA (uridine2552-2'-O)-methyltransferase